MYISEYSRFAIFQVTPQHLASILSSMQVVPVQALPAGWQLTRGRLVFEGDTCLPTTYPTLLFFVVPPWVSSSLCWVNKKQKVSADSLLCQHNFVQAEFAVKVGIQFHCHSQWTTYRESCLFVFSGKPWDNDQRQQGGSAVLLCHNHKQLAVAGLMVTVIGCAKLL